MLYPVFYKVNKKLILFFLFLSPIATIIRKLF